ncbi:MAG: pyridine nucleotide-disulfide oxidoreductase, partial [Thermoprotei archaeon]
TSLDLKAKAVKTKSGKEYGFEKLILATGSKPVVPRIEGLDKEGVFFVYKEADYLDRLLKAIDSSERIVIVGGGFIGVEFADEIVKLGKDVTIVEMLPHCLMLAFDEEFCVMAEEKLKSLGVKVLTNSTVKRVKGDSKATGVELADGREIPADLVLVAIGARPNTDLAREAGLKIGDYGGIVVDSYMRTSHPDVFAVGDCAEKCSFFTGKPTPIMLASIASAEARIAGANLYELHLVREIMGTIGIFSTAVRDLVLGVAGLTEAAAKREGFDVIVGRAETIDKHPGALPGASKLIVKLMFSRQGVLLGGEVAGGLSAGEIVNIIGVAVENRMTAAQLATMQIGTHPLLTAAPTVYPITVAALNALQKL